MLENFHTAPPLHTPVATPVPLLFSGSICPRPCRQHEAQTFRASEHYELFPLKGQEVGRASCGDACLRARHSGGSSGIVGPRSACAV